MQWLNNPMLMLEQKTKDAIIFYEGKVEELAASLKNLESIIQGKSKNLGLIEDGMS